MNNACLKNESEMVNPTIMEMMAKMDKLRQENEQLKADNSEIGKERDEWKEGFTLLHNIIENQKQNDNKELLNNDEDDISMLNKYEKEYLCGCKSNEVLDDYAEALDNCSVRIGR